MTRTELLFSHLRFGEISELSPDEFNQSTLEPYLRIRSLIILGRYADAQIRLKQIEEKLNHKELSFELLKIQLRIFNEASSLKNLDSLNDWITQASRSESDFLLAEAQFTLAYLLGSLARYRQALKEFGTALRLYRQTQFSGQASMARFNYCLCAHHLGLELERDAEFKIFEEEARLLQTQSAESPLTAFAMRFRGYRALETLNFKEAESLFKEARSLFSKLKRSRDAAEVLSFEALIALKTQRHQKFAELVEEFKQGTYSSPVIERRLKVFEEIADLSFPNAQDSIAIIQKYRKKNIDGVTLVIAGDLLLNSLLRARAFEDVVIAQREFSSLPKLFEQAPWLIDYRPYLAEALKHLSRDSEALLVRHSLQMEYDRSNLCEINLSEGHVRHKDKKNNIGSFPLVERMLETLHSFPEGIDYHELFRKIYNHNYNPFLHEARFHSLIARTRKVLPPGMLIWKDGKLCFNSEQPVHLVARSSSVRLSRLRRQNRILKGISRKSEISLEDLSKTLLKSGLPFSKRTMQYDLQELIKGNKIIKVGHGPKTRYKIFEGPAVIQGDLSA